VLSIILCADDYAISPGVSKGILKLVDAGRLSATGCMTASPYWPEYAENLTHYADKIDVGIHLTLTDQVPLGVLPYTAPGNKFPSMGMLLKKSLTGKLDLLEIRQEVQRQIDSFVTHFKRPPAFIDGHHHVQQLPGIRDVVVDAILENFGSEKPYLRVCSTPIGVLRLRRVDIVRAWYIGALGNGLKKRAEKNNIPIIRGFSGVYDFSNNTPYSELFDRFLIGLSNQSLIMCHPGIVDDALKKIDGLTTQREREMNYLLSDDFRLALEGSEIQLARYLDC